MAKRWTVKEDLFIHAYFDALGDMIGPHDLGRPKGAAAKRARVLKQSGAWAALDRMNAAEFEFRMIAGHRLPETE